MFPLAATLHMIFEVKVDVFVGASQMALLFGGAVVRVTREQIAGCSLEDNGEVHIRTAAVDDGLLRLRIEDTLMMALVVYFSSDEKKKQ